jgi:hypothetical protein
MVSQLVKPVKLSSSKYSTVYLFITDE